MTFKALGLQLYSSSSVKDRPVVSGEETPGIISAYRSKRKYFKYIPGLVRDIIKTTMGKQGTIRLKLGFEDPAYTGMAADLWRASKDTAAACCNTRRIFPVKL